MVVAFRRHTLLPLDDCLYALQATIPHLTRASLHRCLQRHGISRLPEIDGDKPAKRKFRSYPIGGGLEGQSADGKLPVAERLSAAGEDALEAPAGRDMQGEEDKFVHDSPVHRAVLLEALGESPVDEVGDELGLGGSGRSAPARRSRPFRGRSC